MQWFRRSKSRPSLTSLALNGAPKSVGKRPSNKPEAEIESTVELSVENDRSMPNFNFQSLGHYLAASQVPHPTYAEGVQTDGIANGYFSQQPSTQGNLLNVPLYYNVTKEQVSNNFFLK